MLSVPITLYDECRSLLADIVILSLTGSQLLSVLVIFRKCICCESGKLAIYFIYNAIRNQVGREPTARLRLK